MKYAFLTIPLLALSLLACGCGGQQTAANDSDSLLSVSEGEAMMGDAGSAAPGDAEQAEKPATKPRPKASAATGPRIPAGTALVVKLGQMISSKTAAVGDTWSGTVTERVMLDGKVVIPAGTPVTGQVTAVKPAKKGDRAMLELALKSVSVSGRPTSLTATTEPVIAGSTRARNLGAIAGGAAAGALLGKAIGGDGKDAAIGAVIGGAAAGGAVAASQGYQVELKEGTPLTFSVNNSVTLR